MCGPVWDRERSGKLTHVESAREVTARGHGHWGYHPYDVELATRTTTWTDSSGTHARTLNFYELRCSDPAVESRYFSTDEERRAFIEQSFTDLTIHELDPPKRRKETHPLASLIGRHLDAVSSRGYDELRWANDDCMFVYAQARIQDAAGQIGHSEPGYRDRLGALAGHKLVNVDELLDRGLVLTFTHDIELVIPLDSDSTDGPEAAEYTSAEWSRGAIWFAGQPPFE